MENQYTQNINAAMPRNVQALRNLVSYFSSKAPKFGNQDTSTNAEYPTQMAGARVPYVEQNSPYRYGPELEVEDKVQSNIFNTPGVGNSKTNNANASDAINAALGFPTMYSDVQQPAVTQQNQTIDPRRQFINDRILNQGRYAIDPSIQASPEQINSIRNSVDNNLLDTIVTNDKLAKESIKKNSSFDTSFLSKSKYLEGLTLNGLVGGGSQDERDANLKYLSGLDENQIKQFARSAVYNKMGVDERKTYQQGENATGIATSIIGNLPADMYNNPYKYQAQKFSSYLGGKGDQRYKDFQAKIGLLSAPIINNIYGAAVTGSELDRANQFIPNLSSDSLPSVITSLRNLEAFYTYANDAVIANKLGIQKPNVEDYYAKYGVSAGQDSSKLIQTEKQTNSQVGPSSTGGFNF